MYALEGKGPSQVTNPSAVFCGTKTRLKKQWLFFTEKSVLRNKN